MKIRLLAVSFIIVSLIIVSALAPNTSLTANNAGAPAGKTGSPGDNSSCASCHSGGTVNAFGILSSNIPPTGYEPGLTYTISATCTDPTVNRFGFEISPQKPSGTKHGTLVITDPTRTKLVGFGKYVTHVSTGTSGAGTVTWSFNWIAPIAGTGDVTFYGAFNFTNHNNASSGDHIKLTNMMVTENLGTTVDYLSREEDIKLWPNPVSLALHFSIPETSRVDAIQIFSTGGGLVKTIAGVQASENFEVNVSDLTIGTYFISFASERGTYSRKFFKQ